ncbi:aromatic amino acid DMT transporter YddG [Kistimonas asteriae]|uniref:aromatic amino acid DMT transporter YddG n=1 Tax=Kistimonas asteriae TaxID=517724 RepID=UPI001BAC2258|nr:aromatic amino acid DMT transporter YddG [Kistimonas asteriae]
MAGTHKYTLAGCLAILFWSTIVAFVRNVTEQLGPVGGAAMIYTVSSILLAVFIGLPHPKLFRIRYLLLGGSLFVSYEIFLVLALGLANDRLQAIEIGLINYLWPCLTVLLTVTINRQPVSFLLYPALLLAFLGVAWTVSGDEGLSLTRLAANVATNPLSYSMAFIGAFIWAVYCNVTKRLSGGHNAITWFFMATASALWITYFISDAPTLVFTTGAVVDLLLAATAMGMGYALWNIGIIGGNMVLLAVLSYFTPLLSTLIAAILLNVTLSVTFWQGVIMVTAASLMCWWLTRNK